MEMVRMSVPAAVAKEIEFLDSSREELRRLHLGRFLVIRRREVLGSFAGEEQAYLEGVRLCGAEPFLIAHIGRQEDRAWALLLVEVGSPEAEADEEFVPHDSWRRGELLDDPIVRVGVPPPPGAQ